MPNRGWPTEVAGYLLVCLGMFSGAFGPLVGASAAVSAMHQTGLPVASASLGYLWALVTLAAVLIAAGAVAIVLAGSDLRKEEDLVLDPLEYPPLKRWQSRPLVSIVAVCAIAVVCVLGLALIPVAHHVAFEVPVETCGTIPPRANTTAPVPAGSTLVFQWWTSDGLPVGQLETPAGAEVTASAAGQPADEVGPGGGVEFLNSSAGASVLTSQGAGSTTFYACDSAGSPADGTGQNVIVTGTDYTEIL